MCRTRVASSPRRRKRPSMLIRQPRSPPTTASAPTLAIAAPVGGTVSISATTYAVGATAGIDTTITTASLVGKTITVSKGLITGFA